jgi:hypothetical protein
MMLDAPGTVARMPGAARRAEPPGPSAPIPKFA